MEIPKYKIFTEVKYKNTYYCFIESIVYEQGEFLYYISGINAYVNDNFLAKISAGERLDYFNKK